MPECKNQHPVKSKSSKDECYFCGHWRGSHINGLDCQFDPEHCQCVEFQEEPEIHRQRRRGSEIMTEDSCCIGVDDVQ